MTQLRKSHTLSDAKKQLLVNGVSKAEGKEYTVNDFIW
jgi:hypothetical protein